jgi:hypothetical protein
MTLHLTADSASAVSLQRTTDHGRPTTDNPLLSHVDHEDFLVGHLLDGVTQAFAAQA